MQYICKPEKVRIYNNTAAKTAAQIKAETGCDALINGGYFNKYFKATGNLKIDGVEIVREWISSLGYEWSGNELPRYGWSEMKTQDNFIGCVPLVENGKAVTPLKYPAETGYSCPRTAFGTFADGRVWMYASKTNMKPEALQAVAVNAGVQDAMMLDSGDSTQGISPDETVTSTRPVVNFICVWADKEESDMPDNKLNIIETAWKWASGMDTRKTTNRIVLHHAAVKEASALSIHQSHISNGWSGIGYHYYIRKDGSIYRGRPENIKGIHAGEANDDSIGICFEGNFESDIMGEAQKNAGIALVADILDRYGNLEIIRHKDVNATACPGRNFPFDEFVALTSANPDIKPAPQPEPKPATNKINITLSLDMLRRGSVGGDVKFLQELLNGKGYPCGNADGIFGANTEKAVTDYQRDNGLTPDGVAGENTWRSLLK